MQIEVSQTAEEIIQQQLASGGFSSASEVVAAMAVHWLRTRCTSDSMPDNIDIDLLAAAQGVGPVMNPDDLAADFWPDEDLDDMLSEIERLRDQGPPRELP